MANDLIPAGRPRNSSKKDFVFYTGGGMGGAGSVASTGLTRYTYWIDHNPFATAIKRLIAQNVSFTVYSATDGYSGGLSGSERPFWLRIEQSNDCPDEVLKQQSEIDASRTLKFTGAQLPPYYLDTKFLSNPTDFNYQNDQGRYVYNAYSGNGTGLARTGAGAFDAVLQAFVPQSPSLTGVWLKDLFRVGSTSDHTLYSDLTVNLYDSSYKLVGVIGKIKKGYPLQYGNNPPRVGVNYNTVYFVTADDAIQYWTEIKELQLIPDKPLSVTVGGTYYIGVMPDTFGASFNYAVGNNADNTGKYNGNGRYIYGQAYIANKTAGVITSITPIATDLDICFVTQRNIGRTGYTFVWDSGTNYWHDPATFKDQFKFVREDFVQRI